MFLMILGAGYTGKFIASATINMGIHTSGTSRSIDNLQSLYDIGISPFLFANKTIDKKLQKQLSSTTHIVQCIKPDFEGDPFINATNEDFYKFMPNLKWIGYMSATSVYGNRNGQWVNENTPIHPISCSAVRRFETEKKWLSIAKKLNIKVAILRLSGIYGPKRNAFISIQKKHTMQLIKEGQVFNRIRVEDIANCIVFLINNNLGGVFNISDDEPSPPQDIIIKAASLMNVDPPLEQDFETANISSITRSFYSENKKISNKKIKHLGFQLLYPNYRISLQQLWENNHYM
ncbi:MAG: NAD(P)-dependent oxidoreductase [Candidatus Liberibacter europaeus]|uniref:NAD(P)-dependent oxidoreductase n=1 Tax=Candidatus Liberibacter europaeus TaxID=744859 RepID=A0A2T4VYK1_9HYPH|nr:NAD(P)-dependent oxidoreductase [Candidatus Liberibacter europaeus]PTL86857.1 MAG: NAD(P)-dependent oxidoreductase [Candidatus Liberibacter europaeus]